MSSMLVHPLMADERFLRLAALRALKRREQAQHASQEQVLAPLPLAQYMQQAWHLVEPFTPLVWNWHLEAIAEHLEAVSYGDIKRLLVNMPPRMGKSLSVSVLWPTWVWTFQPQSRWLCASYAFNLSVRDARRSRRILQSHWYQSQWGTVWQFLGDQNQQSRYENTKLGYRMAVGVLGSATGEGGDCLLIDDPHNVFQASSPTYLQNTIDWFDQTWSTRLNNAETGSMVIVAHRVHHNDLSAHVLAQGGWVHLSLPTEFQPAKRCVTVPLKEAETPWQDPRQQPGELLCAARFDAEANRTAKRVMGSIGYSAQHSQNPTPLEGGMFKRHWWRYWKPVGMDLPPVAIQMPNGEHVYIPASDLPEAFAQQLQSWDMAFKKAEENSFVCGELWARHGPNAYVLDHVHDHLDFIETLLAVRALTKKWPKALLKLVEDKANGPAIVQTLKKEIAGFVEVTPEGSKEARAAAVSPFIEAGNVYLPHPLLHPWASDIISEAAHFPLGVTDDIVDTMSQALRRLFPTRPRVPDLPAGISFGSTRTSVARIE